MYSCLRGHPLAHGRPTGCHSLKENWHCFTYRSLTVDISSVRDGAFKPFTPHARVLTGLILHWPYAGNCSYCELLSEATLPCPHVFLKSSLISGSYQLSALFSAKAFKTWHRGDMACSICSHVLDWYSFPVFWPVVSFCTITHFTKKFL